MRIAHPVRWIALGAVVLGLGASVFFTHRSSISIAQAAADAARLDAKLAVVESQIAIRYADSLGSVNAKLKAVAAKRDTTIRRLESRLAVASDRYTAAAAEAPDTCATIVALADSALAAGDSIRQELTLAVQNAEQRAGNAEASLDTAKASIARLTAAVGRVDAATRVAERAARPSLLSRLLPRPGVGPALVLGQDGRVHAGIGLTLSWTF